MCTSNAPRGIFCAETDARTDVKLAGKSECQAPVPQRYGAGAVGD